MTIAVLIRMNWALRLLVGASSMAPLLYAPSSPPKSLWRRTLYWIVVAAVAVQGVEPW